MTQQDPRRTIRKLNLVGLAITVFLVGGGIFRHGIPALRGPGVRRQDDPAFEGYGRREGALGSPGLEREEAVGGKPLRSSRLCGLIGPRLPTAAPGSISSP